MSWEEIRPPDDLESLLGYKFRCVLFWLSFGEDHLRL